LAVGDDSAADDVTREISIGLWEAFDTYISTTSEVSHKKLVPPTNKKMIA